MHMIKGMMLSRIITRYSMFAALRGVEQKLRTAARAGKVPIAAGVALGVLIGYIAAGFIGVVIGGVLGAIVIDSYKRQ